MQVAPGHVQADRIAVDQLERLIDRNVASTLGKHQFSAIFLEDDTGLAESLILQQVLPARRATLIARKQGPAHYTWDIWMQGEQETVFFDYM